MKERVLREGRYVNNGYYDYDICRKCKGKKCCAHYGCMYSPTDFIVLKEDRYTHDQRLVILTELLKQGKISIDMCWARDPDWGPLNPLTKNPDIGKMSNGDGILYLRARNKNRPVIDFQKFLDETKDYPCINWDANNGCCLSEYERPCVGRMLKPILMKYPDGHEDYKCQIQGEAEVIAAWAKYQQLMYDLYTNVCKLGIK